MVKSPPPGVGLAPGETWSIEFNYVLPDGGLKWLYVQPDPYWADPNSAWYAGLPATGRITESNELNNIYGPVSVNVVGKVYLPLIHKNR
jgi:hypothetical protein